MNLHNLKLVASKTFNSKIDRVDQKVILQVYQTRQGKTVVDMDGQFFLMKKDGTISSRQCRKF